MATAIAKIEEHRTPGERLVAKVRELIRQGNVRRIIIKNEEGRTLIELPLTIDVAGALLVPTWAAIGAIAAIVTECSIIVERGSAVPTPDTQPGVKQPVAHESRAAALLDAHEDEFHVDREC
jgi:hypothetical protein